jgi:hypothetical protein
VIPEKSGPRLQSVAKQLAWPIGVCWPPNAVLINMHLLNVQDFTVFRDEGDSQGSADPFHMETTVRLFREDKQNQAIFNDLGIDVLETRLPFFRALRDLDFNGDDFAFIIHEPDDVCHHTVEDGCGRLPAAAARQHFHIFPETGWNHRDLAHHQQQTQQEDPLEPSAPLGA